MSSHLSSQANVVNAACSNGTASGAAGSGRSKAPKVVIQRKPYPPSKKPLVLFRKQGMRVCTLNTRTLNSTGAVTLLDQELQRWNIQLAGLQEVRWLDSGETTVGDTTFLWSGRKDGKHQEGVALAVQKKLMAACVSWTPINERLLHARFKHSAGHLSVIVAYAPTQNADKSAKEQFYMDLEGAMQECRKNDLKVVLGDFNAVTGANRLQDDNIVGPWGSGHSNENTDLLLSFCRGHHLSIAGSWFQRKDIHRFSWISNDGLTRKEIDHVLSSCGKLVRQCRVYRSFDIDSDHFPVMATLKLKLKRTSPLHNKRFTPNLPSLSNEEVSRKYATAVSQALSTSSSEADSLEDTWTNYKHALDSAAREVLGPRAYAKKPWISQATLSIIDQRRNAIQRGDIEEYRRLAGPRRRSLRHDKKQWTERVASAGEQHLLCGEIRDAFANFRQLRQKCATSTAPLKSTDGKLLSDRASVVARWQEYFSTLLNRPSIPPPDVLVSEAESSTPDPLIDTFPPTIMETYKAMNRIKAGKAPGPCGVYPEYIQHGGTDAMYALHRILVQVWEDEVAPEEWHQGIIIPLYKGKGSRSDCCNYRGITLLSVPGKVFAHVILARIRPTLLSYRRPQQSGFTPGRSTCDRIATLRNIAQRRQDYGRPTFAAYVDLRAAFDSLSRPALWLLLTRIGIPDKIVRLIRALYDDSVSCVRAGGVQSSWFKIETGVRQGCVLAPDSFATSMDWTLERTVGQGMNGVSFGQDSYTDLDFADDVSLLAELLELLVPVLETMANEAASLGLEVNWQKTKVQALGSRTDMPPTLKVQGQEVAVVDEFVYLGSLIHSTTQSTPDIIRRSGITRAAMQSLDNHLWKSRISVSTKLKLYNTCILPIFLYGSECWAIAKLDARRIDALDQWCLRMLLGIKWHQFIRNDEVRRLTDQPNLTAIIQSRRLSLFGHIARMDDGADAKKILTALPTENWRRPPGRPRTTWMNTIQQDLTAHNLTLNEAVDLAQNRPLWRLMATHGATHS